MAEAEPLREFIVPVTIADERRVTVMARDAADAVARVKAGRYKALGRSLGRSFLFYGTPEDREATR